MFRSQKDLLTSLMLQYNSRGQSRSWYCQLKERFRIKLWRDRIHMKLSDIQYIHYFSQIVDKQNFILPSKSYNCTLRSSVLLSLPLLSSILLWEKPKHDIHNVKLFLIVHEGRLHSFSPAGSVIHGTGLCFDLIRPCVSHQNEPENEYLFRSISAPRLETNPSGCVQIDQLGADEDGLWGIIRPHTTFQTEILEIFQGTLQMIHSNVLLTIFFFLRETVISA